MAGFMYI